MSLPPFLIGPGEVMEHVSDELARACFKFGRMASTHEGYAVIKEELDELWDAVKANDREAALEEAVQVAAMAARFVLDLQVALAEPSGV